MHSISLIEEFHYNTFTLKTNKQNKTTTQEACMQQSP